MYSLEGGGAQKNLVDTVNHLNKAKYEITIQTLFHSEDLLGLLCSDVHYTSAFCIRSKILKKLISGFIQYVLPPSLVYRWLFQGDYDVEVAFMEAFPTKILAYSSNRKAKKYAWIHTDVTVNERQDRLYRSLEHQKACYEQFDGICCVAEGVKKSFIKKFDIRKNVSVVYNILNEKIIEERGRQPCTGYRKETFTIVSIGRLVSIKGYDRLIRLCGRLKKEGFAFHLLILGEGPLERELKSLIRELDLMDFISLIGFQENPYPYLAQGDLYVCSSYAEGFSTAVSEAVILKIPVVTTECSGMQEILGDSEYGLITENDDEALYRGIRQMLSDESLYQHYCGKVKERSSFFHMETRLRAYEDLLDR